MDKIQVQHLGHDIPYHVGMDLMRQTMEEVSLTAIRPYEGRLLYLEHADTITTTRLHGTKHLHLSKNEISSHGIDVFETDRGGDVTFHGVGQLVGYPILRLPEILNPILASKHQYDLLGYLKILEKSLLASVGELGVKSAHLIPGKTGIWITQSNGIPNKLIAIGVGCSKGITKHGFAINIRTNLERFTKCILPCGLAEHGVTSLDRILDSVPKDGIIQSIIAQNIRQAFDIATGCSDSNIAAYNSPEILGDCAHG